MKAHVALLVVAALAASASADGVDSAIGALKDRDPAKRRRAARELGRAGADASKAAAELTRIVGDAETPADVRVEAYHALRRIGADLAPATTSLASLLDAADAGARASAVAAFAAAADAAPGAAPALARALADRDGDVRYAAVVALGRFGDAASPWTSALFARAADAKERAEIREAARDSLSSIWGLDETADVVVLAALDTLSRSAPAERDAAAAAFGELGDGAVRAVPALIRMLRSPNPGTRVAAAKALGAMGTAASVAAPDLEKAAADSDKDVARAAADAFDAVRGVSRPRGPRPKIKKRDSGFDEAEWRRRLDRGAKARDDNDRATADREFDAALSLLEDAGIEDMRLAETLFHVGILRAHQRRWADAESAARRSIAIREKLERAPSSETGWAFNNLADALKNQDRNVESEAMARQALMIFERLDPPEPDAVAFVCNQLGTVLTYQERYDEAEKFVRRALEQWRSLHGENHKDVGRAWLNLAGVMRKLKRYDESERGYRAAAAIWLKTLGEKHRWSYMPFHNLGLLYEEQKRWADAEKVLIMAARLGEAADVFKPDRADTLDLLVRVLRAQGKDEDARKYEEQAKQLREDE